MKPTSIFSKQLVRIPSKISKFTSRYFHVSSEYTKDEQTFINIVLKNLKLFHQLFIISK